MNMEINLNVQELEKIAELMENPLLAMKLSEEIYNMINEGKTFMEIEEYDVKIRLL